MTFRETLYRPKDVVEKVTGDVLIERARAKNNLNEPRINSDSEQAKLHKEFQKDPKMKHFQTGK